MSAALEASALMKSASPPDALIRSTVSSPLAAPMSETTTRAPSTAKSRALARPIPLPAPVTSAILPSTNPMPISLLLALLIVRFGFAPAACLLQSSAHIDVVHGIASVPGACLFDTLLEHRCHLVRHFDEFQQSTRLGRALHVGHAGGGIFALETDLQAALLRSGDFALKVACEPGDVVDTDQALAIVVLVGG